jgi:ubiquinone/menaquinone biosynthesis C-methylase UbiE
MMEKEPEFFDFAAEVGLTKHLGGIEATRELLARCQISGGETILDVGCGVGATPAFIAREYGCRVYGIDIREHMVERANETAQREGVPDLVQCRVGDAQDLPFENDRFDAVITESVTAFPEDKQKAVREYVRVTKPGGFVGLNESAWLRFPPPPDVQAWASQEIGAAVQPLTPEEWQTLLENAGLVGVTASISPITTSDEAKGIMARYGFRGMLRVLRRTLALYLRSADYRQFVRRVREGGITPENLDQYFGYGLFVGRKPPGTTASRTTEHLSGG